MPALSPSAALVIKFLEEHPTLSTRAAAKTLWKRHRRHWGTYEACRSMVQYYRGEIGATNRKRVVNSGNLVSNKRKRSTLPRLPKGWRSLEEAGIVQVNGPARVLLLSDLHVPFHCDKSLTKALKHGRKYRADHVLLNGDFMDCHKLSCFMKDPDSRSFADELEMTRRVLRVIRDYFPNARIIAKEGNHEERYKHFMWTKAPELLGIPEFEFPEVVGLNHLDIEWVADRRIVRLGKLPVLHGHEFRAGFAPPVNPARGFFLKAKGSMTGSHHHQSSQHSERNIEGKVISTFSLGCLCELQPQYMPYNNWNHGFATCRIHEDGAYEFDNHRIIDGKVY